MNKVMQARVDTILRHNPNARIKELPNGSIKVIENHKTTAYDRAVSKIVNHSLEQRMTSFKRGRVCYKYKGEGLRNVK
jgi:hypothetical protein